MIDITRIIVISKSVAEERMKCKKLPITNANVNCAIVLLIKQKYLFEL